MNERELLEMAAKAAGIVMRDDEGLPYVEADKTQIALVVADGSGRRIREWNPLTDDGDALRLAVKLRMTIRLEDPAAVIAGWAANQHVPFTSDGNGPWFWKEWGRVLDPAAATRCAIVRAAAEIGRSM